MELVVVVVADGRTSSLDWFHSSSSYHNPRKTMIAFLTPPATTTTRRNNNPYFPHNGHSNKKKKLKSPTTQPSNSIVVGGGGRRSTTTTTIIDGKNGALYWHEEEDEFIWKNNTTVYDSSNKKSSSNCTKYNKFIRFVIRGNPSPLARHRWSSKGYSYNPSATKQEEFRNVLLYDILLPSSNIEDAMLFPKGDYVAATLLFRLKRPKHHFIANRPGNGRLRPSSPKHSTTTKSDIDNLAKFVLDAFNGILYDDDKQIISLYTAKLLDSQGTCDGSTEIILHSLDDNHTIEQLYTHHIHNIYTP